MDHSLNTYRQKLDLLFSQHKLSVEQVKSERTALREAKEHFKDIQTAQALVQEVAERVQQKAHNQIASVVSRCLAAVFGPDAYEFRICFEKKRGRTEARLVFVRDGNELDPRREVEGGALDVAAFALRLACLLLSHPRRRKLLLADEPFHHVNGKEYQRRVGGMLQTLSEEMGVQMILVSDDEWLKIGKVIDLEEE